MHISFQLLRPSARPLHQTTEFHGTYISSTKEDFLINQFPPEIMKESKVAVLFYPLDIENTET